MYERTTNKGSDELQLSLCRATCQCKSLFYRHLYIEEVHDKSGPRKKKAKAHPENPTSNSPRVSSNRDFLVPTLLRTPDSQIKIITQKK